MKVKLISAEGPTVSRFSKASFTSRDSPTNSFKSFSPKISLEVQVHLFLTLLYIGLVISSIENSISADFKKYYS